MRSACFVLGLMGALLLAGCPSKHARKDRVEIFTAHWSLAAAKEVKQSFQFPGMAAPLTTARKFVAVTLLIENTTWQPFSLPILDFKLEDGEGRSYFPKKADFLNSNLGPLGPRGQVEFLVLFEVMRDASDYQFRVTLSSEQEREKHAFDLGF